VYVIDATEIRFEKTKVVRVCVGGDCSMLTGKTVLSVLTSGYKK
jgi:hypothetical protein